MENDFSFLYADAELVSLLSSINQSDTKCDVVHFLACHGIYHANFVLNRVGMILSDLNFDYRTIELGKIAGLLHDIGCIYGKHGHALASSTLCEKFLCKVGITPPEKEIITHAIADHSGGKNIRSAVGAALLIADKTDLSKHRILNSSPCDAYHKNLFLVESVDITIHDGVMNIDFNAAKDFSPAILNEIWSKAFTVPVKAAKYLGLDTKFTVNCLPIEF